MSDTPVPLSLEVLRERLDAELDAAEVTIRAWFDGGPKPELGPLVELAEKLDETLSVALTHGVVPPRKRLLAELQVLRACRARGEVGPLAAAVSNVARSVRRLAPELPPRPPPGPVAARMALGRRR